MKHPLVFLSMALMLLPTACTHMTVAGMISGMQMQPLQLNPEHIQAAAVVDRHMQLQTADMRLRLAYHVDEQPELSVDKEVALQVHAAQAESEHIHVEKGEQLYVATLAEADADIIRAAQQQIRALKARDVEGVGTFAVQVKSACYTSETLPNHMYVRTFLKTAPGEQFTQFTRRVDMIQEADRTDKALLARAFRKCVND
jgi:hypothetical protein